MSDQSERSLVQVQAMVMIYDNGQKEWLFAGSSEGNSKVQIFHHPGGNTFRVVARKLVDHEIVINSAILRTTKYNRATETFHQWRDRQTVYGLSFMSPEDAGTFGQSMENVLLSLNNVTPLPQPPTVPLFQKTGSDNDTVSDDGNNRSLYSRAQPQGIQAAQSKPSGPPPLRPPTQAPPSAPGMTRPPSLTPMAPPAPALTGPPAPPPMGVITPAPAMGGAPPPPSGGGIPPPPPPPPCGGPPPPPAPPSSVGSDDSSSPMGGLAAAIAGAKLKKVTKPVENGPSSMGASSSSGSLSGSKPAPALDMMSEMAKKLQSMKAKAEKTDVESSAPSSTLSIGPSAPSFQKNKVFPPRKTSLVMTQQDNLQSSTLPRFIKDATPSPLVPQSGSDLEQFKQQIIHEMKLEMSKLKEELIEVIRSELGKC